jgi:16S rRNA (guanine527-N7)-methyltransferase
VNDLWTTLAQRANITLSSDQHDRLSRYLDLLLDANTRMNLTRITDRASAEVQHIGDALTALPFLPSGEIRIVDVGAGGGVPGIPLAIARPDSTVLLVESTKKKAAFLSQAIEALRLNNASVSQWRAEEVGHSNSRESFDIAIARAVATLPWLIEWLLPLVKIGGSMLAMKGPKVADEIPASRKPLKLAGGSEPLVHPIDLPGTEHHVIVEIKKQSKSDPLLPRPATSAKGKPLA